VGLPFRHRSRIVSRPPIDNRREIVRLIPQDPLTRNLEFDFLRNPLF